MKRREQISNRERKLFAEYPDVVDVEQLRKMLGGIRRKLAYRLLASGELRSVRIGRSYKITKCCVIEYLTGTDSSDEGDTAA